MALSEGKWWIDGTGELKFVCKPDENFTHEEFAKTMKLELEDLLELGWVRIQNIPPTYLYADSTKRPTKKQKEKLKEFLAVSFHRVIFDFGKEKQFPDSSSALEALK